MYNHIWIKYVSFFCVLIKIHIFHLFCSLSRSRRQFKFIDLGYLRYPDIHRRLFRTGPVGGGVESDLFAWYFITVLFKLHNTRNLFRSIYITLFPCFYLANTHNAFLYFYFFSNSSRVLCPKTRYVDSNRKL